ncbi:MAG TPA: hypothetical protein VHB79_38340 [Polyangiaceae bacterium]|nr:hypothetical protein [Polyangiaceae bacterium]
MGCKSNNIKSSDDDYISQIVGSQGATLSLDDGASVYIPANALTAEREVRLGRVGSGYPPFNNIVASSPVYAIDPMDVTFKIAAQLSAPGTQGTLYFAAPGSGWTDIHGAADGQGHIVATSIQAGFFAAAQSAGPDGTVNGGDAGMGGSNPGGPASVDGELVRADIPGGAAPGGMAFGETSLFYAEETTDSFGVMTTAIKAMPLSSKDPAVVVATLGARLGGGPQLAASGEYVYWIEQQEPMGGPPPPAELKRVKPGGSVESIASGPMSSNLTSAQGSILFVDGSSNVTLYDSASGMLDPTVYGSNVANGVNGLTMITRSADEVFFLTGGGQTAYSVWAGPLGSPASDTGIMFPGAASLMGLGASGSNFFLVTNAGTQANVLKYDTTAPGNPQTIASFAARAGSQASDDIRIDGDDMYAITDGMAGAELIKISLADGMQSKVGSLGQEGGEQVAVTADGIYVLQMNHSGPAINTSSLYKWAR